MEDVVLTLKNGSTTVKRTWVGRWRLLIDFVEDMGLYTMPFEYTDKKTLDLWVKLNERMDSGNISSKLIYVSTIWQLVAYMNPVTQEWVRYCYIDTSLPHQVRYQLYKDVGEYVRSGPRPPYLNKNCSIRTHGNFNLRDDPAYGIVAHGAHRRGPIEYEFDSYSEDVKAYVRSMPLAVITGILHQAYLFARSNERTKRPEEKHLNEVPWDLIAWKDIGMFCNDFIHYPFDSNRSIIEQVIKIDAADPRHLSSVRRTMMRGLSDSPIIRGNHSSPFICMMIGTLWMYECLDISIAIQYNHGKVTPLVPSFGRLWDSIIDYFSRIEFNSSLVREHCITMWYRQNMEYEPNEDAPLGLSGLLYFTLCAAALRNSKGRIIDSSEYSVICQRVADTVGTKTLEWLVDELLTIYEKETLLDIERTKIELFCEQAMQVVVERGSHGFITYPSVAYPSVR